MIKLLKLPYNFRFLSCALDVTSARVLAVSDRCKTHSDISNSKTKSEILPVGNAAMKPQTPRISFPIAVYSHRGGSLEPRSSGGFYVENTLPAFLNSARLGVDLLELDVQLTADGQVVVFHDPTMGRLFGPLYRGRRILDFKYSDIPLMDPRFASSHGHGLTGNEQRSGSPSSSSVSPDGGAAGHSGVASPTDPLGTAEHTSTEQSHKQTTSLADFHAADSHPAALDIPDVAASLAVPVLPDGMTQLDFQVPLLEHIMLQCPGFPIQIDLKVDSPGLAEAVNVLVKQYDLQDKVSKVIIMETVCCCIASFASA